MVSGVVRYAGATWRAGNSITARDRELLGWMGRHGIVTAEQVATRFFAKDSGEVGRRAAYRRLSKLEAGGFLVRRATPLSDARRIWLLSQAGTRAVGLGLAPARLIEADLRHALALVDLMDRLADQHQGSRYRTERELRVDYHRQRVAGTRRPGRGRTPDGELQFVSGETVAIELDLTPKRSVAYERVIRSYCQERFVRVWWYAPATSAGRLARLVEDARSGDFIEVRPLGAGTSTRIRQDGPSPSVAHVRSLGRI